ncbi:MAG: hypothetical protein A2189_04630 [Paenibacillus sp. RIFOXYA1_FULL_44_5]|nr:MAG: hypothetical protein A2189_04630 [Paenibacillus sp. RIFOXYA1_FULL_44_5]
MHIHIHQLLGQYGYIGVFIILTLEMIGIPFPAETTLVFSGIEWSKGVFSIVPLILVASLANMLGSTIAYGIGYYLGSPIVLKYGKYVGITKERYLAAEHKFNQYSVRIVIIAKFFAGIRVLTPYLAGINQMPFSVFAMYNALSAFLWTTTFIIAGRYLGVAWKHYHTMLNHYIIPISILAVLLFIAYWLIKKRKSRVSEAK